jgi:hypothetical protein
MDTIVVQAAPEQTSEFDQFEAKMHRGDQLLKDFDIDL